MKWLITHDLIVPARGPVDTSWWARPGMGRGSGRLAHEGWNEVAPPPGALPTAMQARALRAGARGDGSACARGVR
jgi:hypothetical protein